MIYLSKSTPSYLDEYKLCELWFITKFDLLDVFEMNKSKFAEAESKLGIEKVSSFVILSSGNELLNIDGHWFVGDGYGRIIYSPDRTSQVAQEYKNGRLPIREKYEISKKVS